MDRCVAAVDIGGTKVAVGIVSGDAVGPCLEFDSLEVCTAGQAGLDRVADALARLAAGAGRAVAGIGIGCTGPVDPFTGRIGRVDTIPGWNGLNLVETFGSRLGLPVAVENDADAAALAESRRGAGRGAARFLYVTVSTGIGGGAVLDGALYRGAGGSHPEFGHHVVEASGPACYCGAHGCWEALASGRALARFYGGGASARRVCELARESDPRARAAVERAAFYLGVGLANLVTVFAPDVVVLGGGVMESWPLFEGPVREMVRRHCTMVPMDGLRIVRAALGANAPLAGAAEAWLQRYEGAAALGSGR